MSEAVPPSVGRSSTFSSCQARPSHCRVLDLAVLAVAHAGSLVEDRDSARMATEPSLAAPSPPLQ
jgi:hypothetical protein